MEQTIYFVIFKDDSRAKENFSEIPLSLGEAGDHRTADF
jgi:hypothetical protein